MSDSMIYPLANYGDERGCCFTIPPQTFDFLGTVKEMHVVKLLPEAIRGNHYHQQRKEALIVCYQDNWLFAWQLPNTSEIQQQVFTGRGAVLITLPPHTVHALKNTGQCEISAISCSNLDGMDAVRQVLID